MSCTVHENPGKAVLLKRQTFHHDEIRIDDLYGSLAFLDQLPQAMNVTSPHRGLFPKMAGSCHHDHGAGHCWTALQGAVSWEHGAVTEIHRKDFPLFVKRL